MTTVTELRKDLEDPATVLLTFQNSTGKLYKLDPETREKLKPILKYWEKQGLGSSQIDFSEKEWFFVI